MTGVTNEQPFEAIGLSCDVRVYDGVEQALKLTAEQSQNSMAYQAHAAAAKAGVNMLTKTIALEWGPVHYSSSNIFSFLRF